MSVNPSAKEIKRLRSLPAADRLRWIVKTERELANDSEVARMLGCARPAFVRWIDEEPLKRSVPDYPSRLAIEKWTEGSVLGAIHRDDWETAKERAIVDRVKPFVPPEAA